MAVKGRFAPSPSGRMHLGNLFSALLAWFSVRHEGGSLVLRIEDLDPERCRPEYALQLMEDLRWLGLDWDEGGEEPAYWQSSREAHYLAAFEALKAGGLLYPCFCTRQQRLAEAPHGHEVSPSCPCVHLTAEEISKKSTQRPPNWKVRVPDRAISFSDGLQGAYSQNMTAQCGDFPIRRWDGAWAYQLAVVVDDGAQGVTSVVRGVDLLCSTPQQMYLQELLELPHPVYGHVPLVTGDRGRRLSKRDRDAALDELLARFGTPAAVIGHIAGITGLAPTTDPVMPEELLGEFSVGELLTLFPDPVQIPWR